LESSCRPREPSQEQADERYFDQGLARLHLPFVIDAQAAIAHQPGETPLDHPPLRLNCEALRLRVAPVGEISDPPFGTEETAQVTQTDATHVQIATSAQAPGYLFLADTFYPGWVAHVDGVKTPIYAADGMFRAMTLPSGAHHIVFSYESPTVHAGYTITTVTLVVANLYVCWQYRPRRKEQRSDRLVAVDALVVVLAAMMLATMVGFGLPG